MLILYYIKFAWLYRQQSEKKQLFLLSIMSLTLKSPVKLQQDRVGVVWSDLSNSNSIESNQTPVSSDSDSNVANV